MKPKPIGIVGGADSLAAASLFEQIFCLASNTYGYWKDEDSPKVFVIPKMIQESVFGCAGIPTFEPACIAQLFKLGCFGAASLVQNPGASFAKNRFLNHFRYISSGKIIHNSFGV